MEWLGVDISPMEYPMMRLLDVEPPVPELSIQMSLLLSRVPISGLPPLVSEDETLPVMQKDNTNSQMDRSSGTSPEMSGSM